MIRYNADGTVKPRRGLGGLRFVELPYPLLAHPARLREGDLATMVR